MITRYSYACLFLYAALFTVTEAQQATTQCNTTAADECLKRFSNVSTPLSNYIVNGSDIQASCNAYNEAVRCMDTLTGCKNEDRYVKINWSGPKQSYGHICGAGKTDYLRHQPCLSNGSFASLEKSCSDVRGYLNPIHYNLTADDTCRQYTESLRCKKWAAEAACGIQAGEFIGKMHTLWMDPAAKSVAPTCTGKCNGTALDECTKEFTTSHSDRLLSASLNATELDASCKLLNSTSDCVKLRTGCTDEDTITQTIWLGRRRIAEYSCGEGKTGYLQNRECLSNTTSSRDRCNPPAMPANPVLVCQTVQGMMVCLKNVTERSCGKGAMTYVTGAASRYLAPAVTAINPTCNILGQGSSAAALISSTLVLLASLLLSLL